MQLLSALRESVPPILRMACWMAGGRIASRRISRVRPTVPTVINPELAQPSSDDANGCMGRDGPHLAPPAPPMSARSPPFFPCCSFFFFSPSLALPCPPYLTREPCNMGGTPPPHKACPVLTTPADSSAIPLGAWMFESETPCYSMLRHDQR